MNTGNSSLFDKRIDINIKPFYLIFFIVNDPFLYVPGETVALMGTDGQCLPKNSSWT